MVVILLDVILRIFKLHKVLIWTTKTLDNTNELIPNLQKYNNKLETRFKINKKINVNQESLLFSYKYQ